MNQIIFSSKHKKYSQTIPGGTLTVLYAQENISEVEAGLFLREGALGGNIHHRTAGSDNHHQT